MDIIRGHRNLDLSKKHKNDRNSPRKTILYTRFNVPIQGYRDILEKRGTSYQSWIEEKSKAFLKFCLPSILGQSDKDFQWVIAFGEKTDEVKSILKVLEQYSFITPIFLTAGGSELAKSIRQIVNAEIQTPTRVLTIRLDCDDALNRHFIWNMNNYADALTNKSGFKKDGAPICLNYPYGAKLDCSGYVMASWASNPLLDCLNTM